MKDRPSLLAAAPVVPDPKKGSRTTSPAFVAASRIRESKLSGFCVGWALRPAVILEPLGAGAERQKPIGADLAILVAGLQQFIVEGIVLGGGALRRPDQRFMRIGEAAAAKIRHRIGLAPDNIVQDPKAEILKDRPDPENIVVGADHEDRRVLLHEAADAAVSHALVKRS